MTEQTLVDGVQAGASNQIRRRHVLIVNRDPAFLDAARMLLQREDYNVTTTNLVPRTFLMVQAVGPDVIVIDLDIDGAAIWALVERLRSTPTTARIPIILPTTDGALLDQARQLPVSPGGRFLFLKPFNVPDLADAVHRLVGPA